MSEQQTIQLECEDGVTETIDVTPLGSGIFRLEQTPVWNSDPPLYFGDHIELRLLPSGILRLVRVVEKSTWTHVDWVVPKSFVESHEYAAFGAAVEAAGGRWEGLLGGLLLVHLPESSSFDVDSELERRIAAANITGLKQ